MMMLSGAQDFSELASILDIGFDSAILKPATLVVGA